MLLHGVETPVELTNNEECVLAPRVTLDDTVLSDEMDSHCTECNGTKEQKKSHPHPMKTRQQLKLEAVRSPKNHEPETVQETPTNRESST